MAHLVALRDAMNALHRRMRIALYRPGGMAIDIVIYLSASFVIDNYMFAHNVSERPRYGQYKVKWSYQFVYYYVINLFL